jgi:hypothetical protein
MNETQHHYVFGPAIRVRWIRLRNINRTQGGNGVVRMSDVERLPTRQEKAEWAKRPISQLAQDVFSPHGVAPDCAFTVSASA